MGQVILWIQRVLDVVNQILTLLGVIQTLEKGQAAEHVPYAVEQAAQASLIAIDSPTTGLASLHTDVGILTDLVAAINPVELPVVPPDGYGGASATDVWHFAMAQYNVVPGVPDPGTAEEAVDHLGADAVLSSSLNGYLSDRNPFVVLCGGDPYWLGTRVRGQYEDPVVVPPVPPDWSAWDGSETVLELLQRLQPGANWTDIGPDSVAVPGMAVSYIPVSPLAFWRCTVQDWQLPLVSGRLWSAVRSDRRAPIWPGLENVTLGTGVAIADTFVCVEACNGVLVIITAVPAGTSTYDWGSIVQYPRAGYLSFASDEGYQEEVQPFTFGQELVTPKRFYQASGFYGRARSGVEGTVYPWLINVP